MNYVTFLSGSWWWVKDYPTVEPVILETEWKKTITEYKQAIISKALEGKVEVAPEDQDHVKRKVYFHPPYFPIADYAESEQGLKDWHPTEGKVYPVDLEMEIEQRPITCPECNGNYLVAGTVPCPKCNATGKIFRKVARIKPVKEEPKNSESANYMSVIPDSQFFGSIDMVLNYLWANPSSMTREEMVRDLITHFQNSKKHGYDLRLQTEPTKHEGKERWRVEKVPFGQALRLTDGKQTLYNGKSTEAELQKIADSLNKAE